MVHPVKTPEDLATVTRLFREYQRAIGIDLCFQGFEEELAELPGCYAEPEGGIWLATGSAGVVALRPIEGACEMKRLYVAPHARGTGLGRRLAAHCIEQARQRGYRTMRLDTLATMDAANHIYQALGFEETEAYYDNPLPGVRYYALAL